MVQLCPEEGAPIAYAWADRLRADADWTATRAVFDVPQAASDLQALMRELDGDHLTLDITAKDAPQRIAHHLKEKHGGVDVVVHNAGITKDKKLANMDEDRWNAVINVNLVAPERITRELLDQGVVNQGGSIIGVASIAGIAGNVGQTNYAASKAGVIGLVDSLKDAIGTTAQLFFVGIGAVLFTRFLALAGTADMFTELIGQWALDPLLLVIAVSIVYLILGCFLDPLGMILLTIPVFVPMFAKLNLDLVWLGVLVVKYIGIGLLTPPVGFNIYVVASATGNAIPLRTIFRGCYWFLACEIVIMTLLIAFPQISLFLPNLMN